MGFVARRGFGRRSAHAISSHIRSSASCTFCSRERVTGMLAVWFMDGSTLLGSAFLGGAGPEWALVGAGDMNSDGRADLAWHRPGTVTIWFMNGGAIQGSTSFAVGPEWTPVGAQ